MASASVVLITGATSGIGREASLHLAGLGWRVLATGRNAALLEQLQAEAGKLPLQTLRLDVTDESSIAAAAEEVSRRTDGHGLDALVNNAGFGFMAPMELITPEDLRAQLETNVVGLVRVTQAFLPAMRARGAGRIVHIGSVVGKVCLPLQGVYCATKHAVEALSDAMRLELRPFGVHVSLVEPGTIRSNFGGTATSTLARYRAMDSPYGPAFDRYEQLLANEYRRAPGPLCVARTIARILRARRPGARYVSPRLPLVLIWLSRILPTRWFDAILARMFGLTPKALQLPPR
jgi:NAD(P)-dependent dehydrogenase (short-subunit alcohol dehydrogenase family)